MEHTDATHPISNRFITRHMFNESPPCPQRLLGSPAWRTPGRGSSKEVWIGPWMRIKNPAFQPSLSLSLSLSLTLSRSRSLSHKHTFKSNPSRLRHRPQGGSQTNANECFNLAAVAILRRAPYQRWMGWFLALSTLLPFLFSPPPGWAKRGYSGLIHYICLPKIDGSASLF